MGVTKSTQIRCCSTDLRKEKSDQIMDLNLCRLKLIDFNKNVLFFFCEFVFQLDLYHPLDE